MSSAPAALEVRIGPSRLETAWIVLVALSTSVVALTLPLDFWLRLPIAGLPLGWGGWGWLQRARTSRGMRLRVGLDRRMCAVRSDGSAVEGMLLSSSYVGARVTTLVWRPARSRSARALWILPDMLPRDDFRRLRVVLRYGHSETLQGAPPSHA